MILLSFMCFLIFMISMIVMILASLLSKKNILDREKNSPFECGFDPKSSTRIPFSIRFFLITIIFLIFDVEIALIIPMILTINYSNLYIWMTSNFLFIFILLIGLYHEWNQGALNWSY